jgi:hypothetical protein
MHGGGHGGVIQEGGERVVFSCVYTSDGDGAQECYNCAEIAAGASAAECCRCC